MGVQSSATAADATANEVGTMGEDVKKGMAALGDDVKRVATKVDTTEEEVSATKKSLEKTNSRVEKVE